MRLKGKDVPLYPYQISIHAPHTGCDYALLGEIVYSVPISIHAPHTGCDEHTTKIILSQTKFQSTHPTRGATCINARPHGRYLISIHAPHTGCDGVQLLPIDFFVIISIHAPHTGCDARATARAIIDRQISIHAPHTGCDVSALPLSFV